MTSRAWRGARPLAAPLVVLAVACACSGSASPPTAATGGSAPTVSATAPGDPAAARLLARAVAATRALRSYEFAATETLAANQRVRTRLTGRVVLGDGVAYDLVAGAKHSEVVRVGGATYVREVPGRWSRLTRPARATDPTASLLAVLRGLTSLTRSDVSTVHGKLPAAAAMKAGIPTDGRPADVTVTTDRAGRVVAVDISTSTAAGTHAVTVTLTTTYAGFDRARPVRRPA